MRCTFYESNLTLIGCGDFYPGPRKHNLMLSHVEYMNIRTIAEKFVDTRHKVEKDYRTKNVLHNDFDIFLNRICHSHSIKLFVRWLVGWWIHWFDRPPAALVCEQNERKAFSMKNE